MIKPAWSLDADFRIIARAITALAAGRPGFVANGRIFSYLMRDPEALKHIDRPSHEVIPATRAGPSPAR